MLHKATTSFQKDSGANLKKLLLARDKKNLNINKDIRNKLNHSSVINTVNNTNTQIGHCGRI